MAIDATSQVSGAINMCPMQCCQPVQKPSKEMVPAVRNYPLHFCLQIKLCRRCIMYVGSTVVKFSLCSRRFKIRTRSRKKNFVSSKAPHSVAICGWNITNYPFWGIVNKGTFISTHPNTLTQIHKRLKILRTIKKRSAYQKLKVIANFPIKVHRLIIRKYFSFEVAWCSYKNDWSCDLR